MKVPYPIRDLRRRDFHITYIIYVLSLTGVLRSSTKEGSTHVANTNRPPNRRAFLTFGTALLVAVPLVVGVLDRVAQATPLVITVNGNDSSQTTFDGGIGMISAGGQVRLLIDYKEPQRSEILDLLFCNPNPAHTPASGYCTSDLYGAAIQRLKIEAGGDSTSSVGSDASFLHSEADFNALNSDFAASDLASAATHCHFDSGYQWWLMREARKRNPDIKIGALIWGAPGWISSDPATLYTWQMQQYYLDFAKCAKLNTDASLSAGTPIDDIGLWNERSYHDATIGDQRAFIVGFKSELQSQLTPMGIPVPKLVCCDAGWDPVVADLNDAAYTAFRDAVDVVGVHYTYEPPTGSLQGKPAWASEDWNTAFSTWPPGSATEAGKYARLFNEHYLRDGMTGTEVVPLTDSYYNNLASSGLGQILAYRPWSGHYTIMPSLWVFAQFTQTTEIGWKYLNGSSCFLGSGACRTDRGTGSYVSLRAPGSDTNWTTIAETMNATVAQDIALCPTGGLSSPAPPARLHQITTDATGYFLGSTGTDILRSGDGCFYATLQPQTVYSFTTVDHPYKGEPASIPADSNIALPYLDDFDNSLQNRCARAASYPVGSIPCWLTDQEGSFAVKANCGSNAYTGGSGGKCIEQVVDTLPILWLGCGDALYPGFKFADTYPCNTAGPPFYWTHVGETTAGAWTNYDVSTLVNGEDGGIVRLLARVTDQRSPSDPNEFTPPAGYELNVNTLDGSWDLGKRVKNSTTGLLDYVSLRSCSSGSCLHPFATNSWHRLKIRVNGTTVTACIDTAQLGTAVTGETTYTRGQVGLATLGTKMMFDDLKVTAVSGGVCS